MPNHTEAVKRKKQLFLVALLVVGLIIAVVTQPRPETTSTLPNDAAKVLTSTSAVNSIGPTSPDVSPSGTATDTDRFALRELSRVDWAQMRTKTLFRPRPMEAALAGGPQATGEPMRVQAVYGTAASSVLVDDSDTTALRSATAKESESRRSALMGRAIVRPGEALPDGRTVLRVTPEGVAVTP